MLLVQTLRDQKPVVLAGLAKKGFKDAETQIDLILSIDDTRKDAQFKADQMLAESNALAKQIGELMKTGQKDAAESLKLKTAELKAQIKTLTEVQTQSEKELIDQLVKLPNIPHTSVPEGLSAENNVSIEEWGSIPSLHAEAKPHWDLIKIYDLVDFDLGNKVSGAGFPFYKGKGARLQRALINFFLDEAVAAGYIEVQTPILINKESGFGTGQLPDKDGQMYYMPEDDLYLIPTAEVPITNIYRDVILKEEDLPVKHVGYTPCFRREAGSWGAHVRGLNRLHQFDKVEIVQLEKPEQSYTTLNSMVNHVKSLLEKLELPYRILHLCGGDMSFTSALTYDFEVYSAAQKRWLEVSSVSNFESYQANRLKARYKDKQGKTQLVHTLNGSAMALPRILAALLENNQSETGIQIPKALAPYAGFNIIQ